jgi:branched-chain amino acid transport system substrate-binding protein
VEGGYSRPQWPDQFEKGGPQGQESGQSTPNIYLVKIDNGKVTVPKI